MGRLLLGAVLGYVAYRVIRRAITRALPDDRIPAIHYDEATGQRVIEGGDLVPCAQCHISIPQSTAPYASIDGTLQYFCSEECRAKYV